MKRYNENSPIIKKGDLVRSIYSSGSSVGVVLETRGLGIVCDTNWKYDGVTTGLIQVYWQTSGKKIWENVRYIEKVNK